jgi:DNA polymerase-3 subunit epsilon
MNIQLTNSLAIFDLEATGLNVTQDRIVEIAIVKISPDGTRSDFLRRVNPGIPIPPESTAIHGISDEDVKDAPTLKDLLPELEAFLGDSDVAGFNSNKFDLPLLAEEFLRAGSSYDLSVKKHIDVQNIYHKLEQRTLSAAYQFYCAKDLENAHSALADAAATWEVLDAQIKRYTELQGDVDFLAEFSRYGDTTRIDFAGRLAYNDQGVPVYNFGKHKGRSVEEVLDAEPGYYGWMLDADFPLYTKQCLRKIVGEIREKRKSEKPDSPASEDALKALQNKFKKP